MAHKQEAAAATAATALPPPTPVVLVRNGEPVPCGVGAAAWLKAAPRGAYTTARTVCNGERVFKLTAHVQRLATSANLMAEADSRASDHLAPDAPLLRGDELRPRVVGAMRRAVEELQRRVGATRNGQQDAAAAAADEAAAAAAAAAGTEGAAAAAAALETRHEAKLTVLLTWPAAAGGDGDADAGSSSAAAGEPVVWCHAEPLPPRPTPPVRLQIRGAPRANAGAKDSEWVRQRAALDAARPPGVEEVLLVRRRRGPCRRDHEHDHDHDKDADHADDHADDGGGEVLEGLSSNFFALYADGSVRTARDGVLAGTVRELALEVCAEQGVPVVLEPPSLREVDAWAGAFITSTSRLLLPACELLWEEDEEDGSTRRRVFAAQHPLVALLERRTTEKVIACSEPLQ